MTKNRIGVTGYNGRLGSQLVTLGCFPLPCDITNEQSVETAIRTVQPDIIINCAAYTHVDNAEVEQDRALKVNMWGVKNLFDSFNGPIIQISTDYIFDGKRGNYKENSKPNPISFYGMTKWAGEQVCQAYDDNYCIVRVSGLFGGNKPDFVYGTAKALALKQEDGYPANLSGSYGYVPHIAEALMYIANNFSSMPKILNLANEGIFSRYELAMIIASAYKFDKKLIKPKQAYSGKAKRPKKCGMNLSLAEKNNVPLYSIFKGIEEYAKRFPDPANLQ